MTIYQPPFTAKSFFLAMKAGVHPDLLVSGVREHKLPFDLDVDCVLLSCAGAASDLC